MSTPAAVDHVFAALAATYGAAWDRSLGTAPINDTKSVWADSLSDFTHSDDAKRAILWALKNLPDHAPNSRQFRTLCQSAPAKKMDALPEPKADPSRVHAELAKLAPLRVPSQSLIDCKQWARVILQNPKGRTPTAMQMARDALGVAA